MASSVPPRKQGFYVTTGSEWRRVRDRLRAEEIGANRGFSQALRKALKPIMADVRAQALALPARGRKSTGLRRSLARNVQGEVNGTHVRIAAGSRPGEEALPRGMDSGAAGWRHPVYGNRDVWVHQRGGSWFREPIGRHSEDVERQLTNVIEDMAQNIAAAGFGR